jgi:hypothetical protein
MVGEVDHRILVGARDVGYLQDIVVGQRISDLRRQFARKVLIAIRADIAEGRRDPVRYGQRRYCPDLTVERVGAAMQRIGAVIGDQMIGLPFNVNCAPPMRLA